MRERPAIQENLAGTSNPLFGKEFAVRISFRNLRAPKWVENLKVFLVPDGLARMSNGERDYSACNSTPLCTRYYTMKVASGGLN